MDPVSHTLTGAALGCTGLERRTRFGRLTLIAGANLPDIDAATYFLAGVESLAFRRGITHGVAAVVVLPLLLALAVKGLAMLTRRGRPDGAPLKELLLLAAIAVATHPLLDLLNNYGIRLLMPFVDRWWYGDTLYIIDPIVWTILLAGILSFAYLRAWPRRHLVTNAFVGLLGVYIAASALGTSAARSAALAAAGPVPPQRLMASPVQLAPLSRDLVLEYPGEYRFGRVRLTPAPVVVLDEEAIFKGDPVDLALARGTPEGAVFLHWARFPYVRASAEGASRVLRVADARYVREWDGGFGGIEIEIPAE